MTVELKKMQLQRRIDLLTARGPHNTRIVNKLKRQLRKLG